MTRRFEKVYHASSVQGLTQIVPHVSTHGQNWVYATDEIAVAAIFLGRLGGDFTCASGVYANKPYLCERFAGAFDRHYGAVRGSLYILPGENFTAGQTSFSKDLVCTQPVEPLQEIKIDNAKAFLLQLAAEDKLVIKFYPERFCLPADDRDLVELAARWYARSGERVLDQIRDFHPGLLDQVMHEITKHKTRHCQRQN